MSTATASSTSSAAVPDSQTSQTLNWFGGIIAILIVGLLWFITFALIYRDVPATNQTNLAQIIGMLGIQIGIIIGWFFRGSQNEMAQSKTIAIQADTAAKAQAALAPVVHIVDTHSKDSMTPGTPAATVTTPDVIVPLKAGDTATVTTPESTPVVPPLTPVDPPK